MEVDVTDWLVTQSEFGTRRPFSDSTTTTTYKTDAMQFSNNN